MPAHMLVQIPLIAATGFVAACTLSHARRDKWVALFGGPVPLVLAALFASGYWMLPRALDAVLVEPRAELAKFVTLPLLIGLPLALAWGAMGLLGRGLVWTNFISMLAVLGWLYIAAPVRICNSYLLMQQTDTGMWMVRLSVALLLWWLGGLFVAAPVRSRSAERSLCIRSDSA